MSEIHDLLLKLCRKLPSDFKPYGQRDRDIEEPSEDCSCGCIHFLPLSSEVSYDWGICANPKSPRAGLLTFEHQGCPEFESFAPPEPENQQRPPAETPAPVGPTTGKSKITIDFEEFQMALEGFDSITGEEVRHYLDTQTGEVIVILPDAPDEDELSEKIEADGTGRYVFIERLPSHESFRIMEDFIGTLRESGLKRRLIETLSGRKPFRRFRDAVHSDFALRDSWFKFRDAAMAEFARDWLNNNEIEAELKFRRASKG